LLPAWSKPGAYAIIAAMTPLREDFAGQRQLRFRIAGKQLHLFKHKGESTHQVYLKALAYAFYRDRVELVFEPKTDYKVQPSLADVDMTGEVCTWVQVGLLPFDKLEYVLRHGDAEEVCLVLEATENDESRELDPGEKLAWQVQDLAASIKRHIHYKYTTRKLKILMFRPLDDWFDPDTVDPHPEYHVFYSF
jgi:hypothetical protein